MLCLIFEYLDDLSINNNTQFSNILEIEVCRELKQRRDWQTPITKQKINLNFKITELISLDRLLSSMVDKGRFGALQMKINQSLINTPHFRLLNTTI